MAYNSRSVWSGDRWRDYDASSPNVILLERRTVTLLKFSIELTSRPSA